MMEETSIALPYSDYVQSANTLFHFMGKGEYLTAILKNRTIVPRYCIEDIEYLNIHVGKQEFREIAVLQKCFCDIPFHKLTDTFEVDGVGANFDLLSDKEKLELAKNNSHPDYYGKYAIAFSKKWGECHQLQPVQYVNKDSAYAAEFSQTLANILSADDLPDIYADDVLRRLSYMKPLRGTMSRLFERKNANSVKVKLKKNFHDEREWRYVPSTDILTEVRLGGIIANPAVLVLSDSISEINQSLTAEHYRKLWLVFNYDDIRYIIVPNTQARVNIIDTILSIPDPQFPDPEHAQRERYILISKILVLDEVRKDW